MLKLYYQPFSCSFAVHTALEKIGVPFELIKVDLTKNEQLSNEHLAINPNGQVPVLKDGEKVMTQVGAILLRLSEEFEESELMPKVGSNKRGEAIQSLFFLSSTLHAAFSILFYPKRVSEESSKEVKEKALAKVKKLLSGLDSKIAESEFSLNGKAYAPDYYLFAMLNWLRMFNISLSEYENLKSYYKNLKLLPEIQRTMLAESNSLAA